MSYILMTVSSCIGGRFFISRGPRLKMKYKYKAITVSGAHTEFIRNQSSLLLSEKKNKFLVFVPQIFVPQIFLP